ncbi:MAG: sulfatase-like hydrolase/transferase [Verrucomicrobiota bacterium]
MISFIPRVFGAMLIGAALFPFTAIADRPNVIVIMADDIGWECFSCYGGENNKTPHVDALAASGIRFENAHSQPICTPSRVQIMTGIYNNRNYVKFGFLDPEATTFGHLMKDAGYRTLVAGKWQLEGGFEGPTKFGFDEYCLWQLTRRPSRYPNPGLEINGEEKDFKNGEFGPDLVSDYICDFIEKNKEEPFFVYYPMIAPHWPFLPTPDSDDWDPTMWKDAKGEPGGFKGPEYWDDMVLYTDKMVGKVVAKLEETGLRENTLVIFTGDNGTYESVTSDFRGKKYVGGKGKTKDNGTHVPFVVSWPAVIEPNQVRKELVDFSDVLPTIVEAGGGTVPSELNVDGKSHVPLFRGDESYVPRDYIYCWYERTGIREKASEYVRNEKFKLYGGGRFYNVKKDMEEKKDLRANGAYGGWEKTYKMLDAALRKHMLVTDEFDPLLNEKRAPYLKKEAEKKAAAAKAKEEKAKAKQEKAEKNKQKAAKT